jgi:hypothetical protein
MSTEECTENCSFDCAIENCQPFTVPYEVPTATGFENTNTDQNGRTISTVSTKPASNVNVITTSSLSVLGIHTSVALTAMTTRAADTNVQPAPNEQSTQTRERQGSNALGATASNILLVEIISVAARPYPKESNPSNNELSPNEQFSQDAQKGTTVSDPSVTAIADAQPTVQLGQSMTIGGTTLTLTPGLSTTIGTGSAATYIEIASDATGPGTIIMLSSSGTAVTATVTNAPTTMTVMSTFEASITSAGTSRSSNAGAPASTSSMAQAVNTKDGDGWIVHMILISIGMSFALW